jgi:KDO2-lipid IV(A) lauroyltransferase
MRGGCAYNRLPFPADPRTRVRALLLILLLRALALVPLRALHGSGALLGAILARRWKRGRRISERNLALCFPDLDGAARARLQAAAFAELGKSIFELPRIWCTPPARLSALIHEVRGEALLDEALASQAGVIVCAPHLGCWELLNRWLGSKAGLAILYRPPRQAWLEPVLQRMRASSGAQQIPAEGPAVRALFKRLQSGGMVGILPDQQPKQGEGEFAPFLGVEALTMVLVPRLARRTGARVLFACAERMPHSEGFRIHLIKAPPQIADEDIGRATAALNRGVEACLALAPAQYQWSYKRFGIRPSGQQKFY